jgi:hypothetical protein
MNMQYMRKSLTRQTSRHLRSLTGIVIVLAINFSLHAEEPLSGRDFQHRMKSTIGLTWASNPLRRALQSLSSSQQIAIVLDRRVDPTQLINLQIKDQDLRATNELIAERQSLGVCYVDSVIYFGPQSTTSKLPTLAAKRRSETAQFTTSSRSRLSAKSSFTWDDLATPRELAIDCAKQMKTHIKNPERIPHDLWQKNELPPISCIDFLTITLAGFDLTWQWGLNGKEIELVSIPESVSLQKSFSKKISTKLLNDLRKRFLDSQLTQQDGLVRAIGSFEDLNAIETLLAGGQVAHTNVRPGPKRPGPKRPAPKASTVYTLSIQKQPVGGVLQSLAKSLELQLVYSDNITLDDQKQLISFEVKEATKEQLLEATVAPAGMKYSLVGTELRVTK